MEQGVKLAAGNYFFTVDSDDWLTDDSLQIIADNTAAIDRDKNICGIIALKEGMDRQLLGKRFPATTSETTLQELEAQKCDGERAMIFKTDIARQYPFPTIAGEDFITESVVFDRIRCDWKFLAIDKTLTICEYMPDGLSRSIYQLLWNNPVGFMIYHYQRINQASNTGTALRHALRYHAFRTMAGQQTKWSKYRGSYGWLVRLLAFTAPIGRHYYKSRRNRR